MTALHGIFLPRAGGCQRFFYREGAVKLTMARGFADILATRGTEFEPRPLRSKGLLAAEAVSDILPI